MLNILSRKSEIFKKSQDQYENPARAARSSHTDDLNHLGDYTNSSWMCHSSGNLVDGLPLAIHKDAVLASCRFSGRAPIRKFRCKILDDAHIYRGRVYVNPRESFRLHIGESKLASERSKRLDHRRVLSVSIFQICWIFLSKILNLWNSEKIIVESIWNSSRTYAQPHKTICIASGKPSTRFPLEWHVQKGYVLSHSHLVVSRRILVRWGSLIYKCEYAVFLNFQKCWTADQRIFNISGAWNFPILTS